MKKTVRGSQVSAKQNFFNRYFFLGAGLGTISAILVVALVGYFMLWKPGVESFSKKISNEIFPENLKAPPLPSGPTTDSDALTDADYRWTVKTINGDEFKMDNLKGKVVFLNFWATWCPPCVDEMPTIESLYKKMKDEAVVFLCVSEEDSKTVSNFIKKKGFTLPVYLLKGQPPAVFRTDGIPATFLLSSEGKIVFKHVGSAKWDHELSVDFIKKLIKGSP